MIDKLIKFKMMLPILFPLSIFFLLILVITLLSNSSINSENVLIKYYFDVPLESENIFITSKYGMRLDPFTGLDSFHDGIDLVSKSDDFVIASAYGFVIKAEDSLNSLGTYVKIEHSIEGEVYQTLYAHLLEQSILVVEGEYVEKGQRLGIIGNSGRSTGTHLHFSIYKLERGEMVSLDPEIVIERNDDFEEEEKYDY